MAAIVFDTIWILVACLVLMIVSTGTFTFLAISRRKEQRTKFIVLASLSAAAGIAFAAAASLAPRRSAGRIVNVGPFEGAWENDIGGEASQFPASLL